MNFDDLYKRFIIEREVDKIGELISFLQRENPDEDRNLIKNLAEKLFQIYKKKHIISQEEIIKLIEEEIKSSNYKVDNLDRFIKNIVINVFGYRLI